MRSSNKKEWVERTRYLIQSKIQRLEKRSSLHALCLSKVDKDVVEESLKVINKNQESLRILYLVLEKINEDNVALIMSGIHKIGTKEDSLAKVLGLE